MDIIAHHPSDTLSGGGEIEPNFIPAIYGSVLYAIATAAYVILVVLLLSKHVSKTGIFLAVAGGITALQAAAVACAPEPGSTLFGGVGETLGLASWCVFLLHLLRAKRAVPSRSVLLLAVAGTAILSLAALGPSGAGMLSAAGLPRWASVPFYTQLLLAIYGVLLTENLYRNTAPEYRWHVNLLCIGLGGVFAYEIVLNADALMFQRISPVLWDGRAIAMAVAAPLIAVAAARNREWAIDIHVSRSVVFHTTTLIASGVFLLALALVGEVFRLAGPSWGVLAETVLMIVGIAVVAVLLTSGAARSRLKRLLAENFYSHRFDYRREWLKCSDTLSAGMAHPDLEARLVKAVADIVDSPAGALWVRDLDGRSFQWAGSWNLSSMIATVPASEPIIELFGKGAVVVEIGRLEKRPAWLDEVKDAWIAVPLAEHGRFNGFVVLVRPRAPQKLDEETCDLLRIVAYHAASHLAEQQYARALSEVRQVGDFSKRLTFAIHDMKNVASQLSMIVQNAEMHFGDEEFQRDIVETVRGALDRLNGILAGLRPRSNPPNEMLNVPLELINDEVNAIGIRGIKVSVEGDGHDSTVSINAREFRSVIRHLCENACEASPGRVRVSVSGEERGRVVIDVIDHGAGMTPEFIRDELFRPFGSTKRDGLGIGAYQARELIRRAGGELFAVSRVGKGTTMRIVLPKAGKQAQTGSRVAAQVAS